MELLSPSYLFLNDLIMSLDAGVGVRRVIEAYVGNSKTNWSKQLANVFFKFSTSESFDHNQLKAIKNSYERAMLSLILRSLSGQPVLKELKELEHQYFRAHEQQLDLHILKLPYLTLIPLFLFLFPSYLLLMLGPILKNLLVELSK